MHEELRNEVLKQIVEDVDWVRLAQDRVQREMFPLMARDFWTSRVLAFQGRLCA